MNSTSQTLSPSMLMYDTFMGRQTGGTSLDQWNCAQQSAWDDRQRKQLHPKEFPNGLICPKDAGNLYDTGQVFLPDWGNPGRLRVKCTNHDCDFRGERFERVKRITD